MIYEQNSVWGENQMAKDQGMGASLPVVVRRKLIGTGDSTVVVVPNEWLRQHGLKKGDSVILVANSSLKILPESKELVKELHRMLEGA